MAKITIETDEGEKVIECDEYWVFGITEEGHFQHHYHASDLFRSKVQSHVTLVNLSEHMSSMKEGEEYREETENAK